jgi:phosphoglycolate phosphatase
VPDDATIYAAFGPSERVILRRLLPPEALEPAYTRLQRYYSDHASGLGVHPRMRTLLADLRRHGLACGLFTGRGGDSTAYLLAALDLAAYFHGIVAGDAILHPPAEVILRPKPAPDGVLHLCRVFGMEPARVLVVGDSQLDLDAARAAGARGALASWHPWPGRSVRDREHELHDLDALRLVLDLE